VRHHRAVPADHLPPPAETCPGCGAVLLPVADSDPAHAGASASCARLFEDTLRGIREEAASHPATAPVVALADAAYDAQHPVAGDDDRLRAALGILGVSGDTFADGQPSAWRTTVADVAADLDVIDLGVLVATWARAVQEDWAAVPTVRT
jgi:hypothetical protein